MSIYIFINICCASIFVVDLSLAPLFSLTDNGPHGLFKSSVPGASTGDLETELLGLDAVG